jgi:hypothetical protein
MGAEMLGEVKSYVTKGDEKQWSQLSADLVRENTRDKSAGAVCAALLGMPGLWRQEDTRVVVRMLGGAVISCIA